VYAEAEGFCRRAIKINPDRHNAYKNLGLALAGQRKFPEAVKALVKAVRVCPKDPRAFKALEDLLTEVRPDLLMNHRKQLEECREQVERAAELERQKEFSNGVVKPRQDEMFRQAGARFPQDNKE
jgi:tetratricopeptide (TPR) repeat protein